MANGYAPGAGGSDGSGVIGGDEPSGRSFMDMFRGVGDRAAAQVRAMPSAPSPAPAAPAVTVRKGAYQAGPRRPVAAPVKREQGMNMGDYDNGMGGMFGEAEQEGDALTVDALGLARTAATGGAPSAAQILGQQGLDRAAADQQSLAASARGPAALAMAQQQQGYNTAAMQQQGAAQMAAMRAQEMDQARNRYLEGTGLLRGQRQARYGQELQRGTNQAQIEGQHQQGAVNWYNNQADTGTGLARQGIDVGQFNYNADVGQEDRRMGDETGYQSAIAQNEAAKATARGALGRQIVGGGAGAVNQITSSSGGGAKKKQEEAGVEAQKGEGDGSTDDHPGMS